MGDYNTYFRSFGGGEVTPEFFGRIDDAKYQTGLATCRNFIVQPHGPIQNRPGTRFVREVKDSDTRTRTLPFVYSFDQSLLVEFSVGVFRFHAYGQTVLFVVPGAWATATDYVQGALVSDGGRTYYAKDAHTAGATFAGDLAAHWYQEPDSLVYEVPHPYLEGELFDVKFCQSGDIVTLVHRNHPPRELKRLGATDWTLTDIAFAPVLDAPTGTSGTPTPGGTPGTPFDTLYAVTALTGDEDESLQSATVTISNNLYDDGASNLIEWDAVDGAVRYNVYKKAAGLFGYIGQTDQLSFIDDNIASDPGRTPPLDIHLFEDEDDYPGAVSYAEQRRAFAGTNNKPQNLFLSRAGTESNMNYSIPPQDKDSIQIKIASREANPIIHLTPMTDLLALTASAIWRVNGGLTDILTPLTVSAKPNSFVGVSGVKPALVGNNMIYAAARGGHLRELGYDDNKGGYISGDVSIRAPHLFDGFNIVSMTVALAPFPIVWAVSSSGKLIGFTYIPEQQVGAFHWHDTQGTFEDATTLNENGRDVTYVVVKRRIGETDKRYIEYFADRLFDEPADQHFVDCGALYDDDPTDTVEGIDWLEGMTVSILADGAVMPDQDVIAGTIVLPSGVTASKIHVGLSYSSDMKTLPMALEIQGYAQGLTKNVNEVWLRVYRSSGMAVGPSFDELIEYKQRTTETFGAPPNLITDRVDVVTKGDWTDDGAICVRQRYPLALTLLSLSADITLGGG